jgi:hypothetical protein
MARFDALLAGLPAPIRILDIGGTNSLWEQAGYADDARFQITILNHCAQPQQHANVVPAEGDARALRGFADHSFDVVFSNSVIEHLFTRQGQAAMASEIRRVGRRYWVQTPNYWFPFEPHFHFVGWQWLPESWRVAILRRRDCGWRSKTPDLERARELVREVRLLRRHELKSLFPGARIESERMVGLVKSWIAVGGFESVPTAS